MGQRRRRAGAIATAVLLAGCNGEPLTLDEDEGSSTGGPATSSLSATPMTTAPPLTSGPPNPSGGPEPADSSGTNGPLATTGVDSGSSDTGINPCKFCPTHEVDIVFVVDNSRTMGPNQRKLAQAVPTLLSELASLEQLAGIELDLNVMVTTTDFGNPLCTPFEPAGYDAAMGAPVSTACVDRLQDFDGILPGDAFVQGCLDVCAASVAPAGPFIHITDLATDASNVVGGTAQQAMQCLLPQGNVGCGFESPLETMLRALDPGAAWNSAPSPFLRPAADLVLVVLTDEMDCSVLDYGIMTDTSLMNTNPDTAMAQVSSAICFNAGADCVGPDPSGEYASCVPQESMGLQPLARYTDYLVDEFAITQGKRVMMVTVTGIPHTTAHDPDPPYLPTAGGIDDLVYREWEDGEYPVGDIVPPEFADGVTAANKTFDYGIGPGCTGPDGVGGWTQAIPPLRIASVCDALGPDRCCMESICDDDFAPAMQCLRGMLEAGL